MGYSTNPETIENRRDLLGPLMEGQATEWQVNTGTEGRVAYQIRECLHLAKQHPNKYPTLAKMADHIEIRVHPGLVVALPSAPRQAADARVRPYTGDRSTAPQGSPTAASGSRTQVQAPTGEVPGPQSVDSIIGAWMHQAPHRNPIVFPQAGLDADDMRRLFKWAQTERVLLFYDHPSVTVRPYDEDLFDFAFNPDEDL